MENIKRILEIKANGPESATNEDIPLALGITCQFINTNPKAQELIKEDVSAVISIKGAGKYHVSIKGGKCEFGEGDMPDPDFTLTTDLITISKMLLGQIDPSVAYFSGEFEAEGELYQMILYLEILDIAFQLLEIINTEDRVVLIEISDMKKLFDVYARGSSTVDPAHIPLFFNVLTIFSNHNPEAQEHIADENQKIQMTIREVGSYVLEFKDGVMSWSEGEGENVSLKLEMDLKTSAQIVLDGDAVSAFMAGDISLQGNVSNGLFMQELIEIFLDTLDLN